MTNVRSGPTASAKALLLCLRAYQALRAGRPSPCRHVPACSAYAIEAVELHGSVRGTWLAIKRVTRCRPFGSRGYDPVPS